MTSLLGLQVISPSNSMYIEFRSDHSQQRQGFAATFEFITVDEGALTDRRVPVPVFLVRHRMLWCVVPYKRYLALSCFAGVERPFKKSTQLHDVRVQCTACYSHCAWYVRRLYMYDIYMYFKAKNTKHNKIHMRNLRKSSWVCKHGIIYVWTLLLCSVYRISTSHIMILFISR